MALKTCEMRVLYISVIMMGQFDEILSCPSISKCLKVLKKHILHFSSCILLLIPTSPSPEVFIPLHFAVLHIEHPSLTK